MSKRKFQVDLDAIRTTQITVYVEAENEEEAYDMVASWNEVNLDDEEDERAFNEADEIDIRNITDEETGEVIQY